MRIEYGTVFSRAIGTPAEMFDLHQALIPPDAEDETSMLREDGSFYTGLLPYIRSKLEGIPIDVEGQPISPFFVEVPNIPSELLSTDKEPEFRLRDYQALSIRKALMAQRGVVEIATGGGKTEVAAGVLICLFWKNVVNRALYLVGTAHLLNQTVERLQRRGVPDVGILGDGKRQFGKARVLVATVQSVSKCMNYGDEQVYDYLQTADALFLDECHHAQARTWMMLAESCPAVWRFGLTATVWDDPKGYTGSDLALIGLMGPPICHVSMRALISRGFLAEPTVIMPPMSGDKILVHPRSFNAWFRTYRNGIVRNTQRNSLILSYARFLYERGYRTLIFTAKVEHGDVLLAGLEKLGIQEALFLSGGSRTEFYVDGKKQTETWDVKRIAQYIQTHERCVIVGTPVMDEGLDFPGLNCLIMGGAMQKYRRTIQRVGRGLRPKQGENRVVIVDPFDLTHPFLEAHADYRRWTYETESFPIYDRPEAVFGEDVPVDLDLVAKLGLPKLPSKPTRVFCKGRRFAS